jgi:octaprenyl-diphosphate synthase
MAFKLKMICLSGKPTGIDIKEQKMTLPLIHVLNTCTAKEKSWLINSIKNNKDKRRVKEIAFVKTMMACFTPKTKWSNFSKKHFAIRKLQPFRLQRSLNFDGELCY